MAETWLGEGGGGWAKNEIWGIAKSKGGPKILGGPMSPNDVMVHSVHWGINPPKKHPPILCQAPP